MAKPYPIVCPICSETFMRLRKCVAAVIRRSGRWACQGCVTTARNVEKARPIGSERIGQKGYVVIKTASGWVRRNRVVMEAKIGRKLLPTEDVHHRNGIKADDSADNLVLIEHGQHTVEHHIGSKRTGQALQNIRRSFAKRRNSRLNPALAAGIRIRAAAGEKQRAIAHDLEVSPMTISRAARGESWKSSTQEAPKTSRSVHLLGD